MFNKEAFVQTTDQELSWTMALDGSDPLSAKQRFCFKFLCHSCSPPNQCDLRLPQPTKCSHETRLHTVEGVLFLAKMKGSSLYMDWKTTRKPICRIRGATHKIMWAYSTVHAEYNVCVSVEHHPPPGHRLQGGLYSGWRFSLCLCRKERAMWSDEDASQFPVEWKNKTN